MPYALHGLLYLLTIYMVSKIVEKCGKQSFSQPKFLGDGIPRLKKIFLKSLSIRNKYSLSMHK